LPKPPIGGLEAAPGAGAALAGRGGSADVALGAPEVVEETLTGALAGGFSAAGTTGAAATGATDAAGFEARGSTALAGDGTGARGASVRGALSGLTLGAGAGISPVSPRAADEGSRELAR
jgi:hypothetical protein